MALLAFLLQPNSCDKDSGCLSTLCQEGERTENSVPATSTLHSIQRIAGRSDAANFDFKACPELAAGEYRISLKSKLPHLASILD
jgi:hypothetical protein